MLASERALAIDPDYDEPYVIIGMERRESDDFDGAIAAFKRAIEINPSCMEAHANLGETYLRCRKFDSAVRELQWAVQLRPEVSWIHLNLALAHWKRGEIINAAGDWGTAIYLYFRNGLHLKTGAN